MSEVAQCKDCKWWYAPETNEHYDGEGECHKNAPRKTFGVGTGYEEKMWPLTKANDFCSEFEAKE